MLTDLLMSGKFDLVRKVLSHVAKCIVAFGERKKNIDENEKHPLFAESDDKLYIPSMIAKSLLLQSDTSNASAPAVVGTRMRTLLDKFAAESEESEKVESLEENTSKIEEGQDELPFREVYKIFNENISTVQLADLSSIEQVTYYLEFLFSKILDGFDGRC